MVIHSIGLYELYICELYTVYMQGLALRAIDTSLRRSIDVCKRALNTSVPAISIFISGILFFLSILEL
jgi:hypothetical protein